ncbi:hypothetical protein MNV49_006543 [Pseudohyphozyma bogoriensis]|nr:hypothetical protein MNV49_006543 [Pseudohyphozyma bogoriensis]
MPSVAPAPLRVAIIGGGPGGLGAAIFLLRLENVSIKVYEQATELREIGAGIHLQANTWKMLVKAGARDAIDRLGSSGQTAQAPKIQHINGRTMEVLKEADYADADRNVKPALLEQVPTESIHLKKKLVDFKIEGGVTTVFFSDGTTDEVDLLVGADGLRSVVRQIAFPSHKLAYTGQTGFRTLFPYDLVKDIPGLPDTTVFLHGTTSHVFTTQVGNGRFEISTRAFIPSDNEVSWGVDIRKEEFLQYHTEFHPTVQAILDAAPSTGWKKFAMFSGPELETLVHRDSVVLVGDASHRAGAGFALEDGYILSLAIQHSRQLEKPLSYALDLFNQTRLPHYSGMYAELARGGAVRKAIPADLDPDERLRRSVGGAFGDTDWIYNYDADKAWAETLAKAAEKESSALVNGVAALEV